MSEKVLKKYGSDPGGVEKVRKHYGTRTRRHKHYVKSTRNIRPNYGTCSKYVNTKGAGAEGARPLCWAAECGPHVFDVFRISGSGFVFVSAGVGLACGIPGANF